MFNSSYHFPEPLDYCTWTKIPNTLPIYSGLGTQAKSINAGAYDEWLQMYLDSIPYSYKSGFNSGFRNGVSRIKAALGTQCSLVTQFLK